MNHNALKDLLKLGFIKNKKKKKYSDKWNGKTFY